MSEIVHCPDCDEKVTLKPGKAKVTCPACGGRFAVEGPDARGDRRSDDRDDPPPKKKPKRKYREEWDDDDDEDDKPPPKPKGSLAWLWILLGVLGVLVAGCGGLVWWVVTLVGQAKQNFQQRMDEDQKRFEQQFNAQPGNPQGRPKPPAQPDSSVYDKKKPFDVDPQLAAKPSPVFLDDLQPFDVKQGQWPLGRHGALGFDDRWVCVNGTYYDHGIGQIPPNNGAARVSFAVGGLARRLKGQVALNDYWHDGDSWEPVTFAVYKDGKEVWRSQPTKKKKTPQEFDLNVTGARVIMLETNAPGSSHDAHCVWLDPVLEK
jgi:uncharacterized Zn finger protein (UPF0148 family)